MLVTKEFWSGRRVFITGQTGFKGAWLAFWLAELGAEVFGLALPCRPTQRRTCTAS
jgi:CDP-glucose 4,6-dehydratase